MRQIVVAPAQSVNTTRRNHPEGLGVPVRNLSEKSAAVLLSLLAEAEHVVREHAAEHSYRATAMKAIRERLLHQYHTHHAASLLGLADSINDAQHYLTCTPKSTTTKQVSPRRQAQQRRSA
jgi:hypothetical protein